MSSLHINWQRFAYFSVILGSSCFNGCGLDVGLTSGVYGDFISSRNISSEWSDCNHSNNMKINKLKNVAQQMLFNAHGLDVPRVMRNFLWCEQLWQDILPVNTKWLISASNSKQLQRRHQSKKVFPQCYHYQYYQLALITRPPDGVLRRSPR